MTARGCRRTRGRPARYQSHASGHRRRQTQQESRGSVRTARMVSEAQRAAGGVQARSHTGATLPAGTIAGRPAAGRDPLGTHSGPGTVPTPPAFRGDRVSV